MFKEVLEVWQPVTNLIGRYPFDIQLTQIVRHNDYLKIELKDNYGNALDIIYDDPDDVCPLEYVVWGFKYSTEFGSVHLNEILVDDSGWDDTEAVHFFKVRNSKYIQRFDGNLIASRELFPEVEHHFYLTADEIFEVIANYEPRFIVRRV